STLNSALWKSRAPPPRRTSPAMPLPRPRGGLPPGKPPPRGKPPRPPALAASRILLAYSSNGLRFAILSVVQWPCSLVCVVEKELGALLRLARNARTLIRPNSRVGRDPCTLELRPPSGSHLT